MHLVYQLTTDVFEAVAIANSRGRTMFSFYVENDFNPINKDFNFINEIIIVLTFTSNLFIANTSIL